MKINLNESEIREGVMLWIEREGFSLADKTVDIAFTAGRGPTGLSCDVDAKSHTMIEDYCASNTGAQEEPPVTDAALILSKPGTAINTTEAAPETESPFLDDPVDGEQPALDLDLD